MSVKGVEDQQVSIPALTATDDDSPIVSYTVTSLPDSSLGTLYYAGGTKAVIAGDVLTPTQAGKLVFVPVANKFGHSSFGFTAKDSTGAASNIATVDIVIDPQGDAPAISGDVAGTVKSGDTFSFGLEATDVDTGTGPQDQVVQSFIISKLPASSEGSIKLSDGTVVTAGMKITPAAAKTLVFVPASGFSGRVNMQYLAEDGDGLHSATGNINVTVQASFTPTLPPTHETPPPAPKPGPKSDPVDPTDSSPKNEPNGGHNSGFGGGLFSSSSHKNDAFGNIFNGADQDFQDANVSLKLVIDVPDQVFRADKPQEFQIPEGAFKHTDLPKSAPRWKPC